MIQITADSGEFTIENGEIKTVSEFLKYVFESVSEEIIQVYEGDVDYALGKRMMKYLPNSKIKKFEPAALEKDVVY